MNVMLVVVKNIMIMTNIKYYYNNIRREHFFL